MYVVLPVNELRQIIIVVFERRYPNKHENFSFNDEHEDNNTVTETVSTETVPLKENVSIEQIIYM